MSAKIRCGVIGVGKMGMLHASLANAIEGSELAAVCEPNRTMRNWFETLASNVSSYQSYAEMLDAAPLDAVFICTPPSSHIEIATACVRKGCHVFIEKPLCLAAEDAKPLVELLKQTGKIGMVGYMMRYADTFSKAREILKQGVLGRVLACRGATKVSQMFKAGKGWRYSRKESGGGVLISQGIHAVDLMCWMLGTPRSVNLRTNNFYSETVEDFAQALFSWKDGIIGSLDSSWSVDGHRLMLTSLEMTCENGTLTVDDDTVRLFLRKASGKYAEGWTSMSKPELSSGHAADIGGTLYTGQDEAFLRAVRGQGEIDSDVRSAWSVQHVMDCLYKSADENGTTVDVDKEFDRAMR
jgi:predicted dehydrogenase